MGVLTAKWDTQKLLQLHGFVCSTCAPLCSSSLAPSSALDSSYANYKENVWRKLYFCPSWMLDEGKPVPTAKCKQKYSHALKNLPTCCRSPWRWSSCLQKRRNTGKYSWSALSSRSVGLPAPQRDAWINRSSCHHRRQWRDFLFIPLHDGWKRHLTETLSHSLFHVMQTSRNLGDKSRRLPANWDLQCNWAWIISQVA